MSPTVQDAVLLFVGDRVLPNAASPLVSRMQQPDVLTGSILKAKFEAARQHLCVRLEGGGLPFQGSCWHPSAVVQSWPVQACAYQHALQTAVHLMPLPLP
jgi:hypothetical protein